MMAQAKEAEQPPAGSPTTPSAVSLLGEQWSADEVHRRQQETVVLIHRMREAERRVMDALFDLFGTRPRQR
jgi:hypothetical protein